MGDNCCKVKWLDMDNLLFITSDNIAGGGKLFFPSSVKLLLVICIGKNIYTQVYQLGIIVMFDDWLLFFKKRVTTNWPKHNIFEAYNLSEISST